MKKQKWMTWAAVALVSLGLHYAVLILSQILIQGSFTFSGFIQMITDRLTEPGDAVRYLDIARNGYVREGENAINLVFYPLYPFLMRALSVLTGGRLALAGLILSQTCYAGASVMLYELLLLDHDHQDAWWGVLMLALYPFSMFVMGVFSEGLFLLLSISCLYAIRKRQPLLTGVTGFLAALCRLQGMLLIFPAVYEAVVRHAGKSREKWSWKEAFVLLIPLGFCVYLAINYHLHRNPFQFLIYERDDPWFQTSEWIGRNIALQYSQGHQYEGLDWIIYYPQIILYFLALGTLFFGAVSKEKTMYLLYGGVYLGFTYLSGWMISGGRYMLGCVPLFLILAGIRKTWIKHMLLLLSGVIGFGYALLYYMGFSIM